MTQTGIDKMLAPVGADADAPEVAHRLARVRQTVSAQEWEARVELAALYRLINHNRWTDSFYTHITMRVPGEEAFLINPFGYWFHEITASSLTKVDIDGQLLNDPTGLGINHAGFIIHGALHEARHDVRCVLHTHTRAGIAVSILEEGLLPISQHACGMVDLVAYHDFEGVAINAAEQARLVEDLGSKSAMILRNHGLLTAGRTAAEAFILMSALQRACEVQVDALAMGRPIRLVSDDARHAVRDLIAANDGVFARDWRSLLRLADQIAPDFRS